MHDLSEGEYGRVLPFFESLQIDRLAVLSVIQGAYPGRVFVDRKDEPTAAIIAAGSCYLGGNAGNAAFNEQLKELLATEILPGLEGEPLFLFSSSDEWKDTIDKLLKDLNVIRISRHKFELDAERLKAHGGWQRQAPAGCEVRRVDRSLAEAMPSYALEYWRTIDGFLRGGFGYAVAKGDELVSPCWTMLVGGGVAELAVETAEGYRRRGFATLASCACIEHCLEKGLQAEWDCFELPASMNLAQKLGFVKKLTVEVHFVTAGV